MTKSKNISITITIAVPRVMFDEVRDVLKDAFGYLAFAHMMEQKTLERSRLPRKAPSAPKKSGNGKRGRPTILTREAKATIKRLRGEGRILKEIAEEVGVGKTTVAMYLKTLEKKKSTLALAGGGA